jgi:hypothetical protein
VAVRDWDELSRFGEAVVRDTYGKCEIRKGPYVRIRPPTRDEAGDAQKDSRTLKFMRVGVRVEVDGPPVYEDRLIEVRCGGDVVLWSEESFRMTFVRLVDGDEFRKNELDEFRKNEL